MAAALTAAAWLSTPPGTSWGRSGVPPEIVPFVLALLDRALPGGRVDVKGARFTGGSSGRVLSLPCALSTCKVPPKAVLRVFG